MASFSADTGASCGGSGFAVAPSPDGRPADHLVAATCTTWNDGAMARAEAPDDLKVIDVDTHLTEPHDLWTSRAPKGYEDRLPRVVDVDGVPHWAIDGIVLSRAGSSSVVAKDGSKS